MQVETCIYCGAELPPQQIEREGDWWKSHDWKAEREIHKEDCEWVETHAHTIPHPANVSPSVETPIKPIATPTPAQQLAWATVRCAELQAKVHRLQGKAMESLMWLSAGDNDRAKQAVNAIILDL